MKGVSMTEDSPATNSQFDLSEVEKARIRAEVRYAVIAAKEAHPQEKSKSLTEKIFAYLSNGFVLLLIGSLITSWLVPHFQREYEARKQQAGLMQDCLAQFLLYSNSIWQEYYTILPLTQKVEIDQDEYFKYTAEIAQIKLKRYDAFSKVQSLAIVFPDGTNGSASVESSLKSYAIRLNTASAAIDAWLTNLYCTPTKRKQSPCASFDPTFDSFNEYTKIKKLVVEIGNQDSESVATLMVKRINEY